MAQWRKGIRRERKGPVIVCWIHVWRDGGREVGEVESKGPQYVQLEEFRRASGGRSDSDDRRDEAGE